MATDLFNRSKGKRAESNVQSADVTYELHSLGWKAFQNLCVTIAGQLWGQTVQSFFDSNDGGRDGAFHGTWKQKQGEVFEGTFTAQCKFTAKANKQLRPSELKDELVKAKRLAAQGLARNYFLFTNACLAGTTDEALREAFQAIPGISRFTGYGCERISQIIRESPLRGARECCRAAGSTLHRLAHLRGAEELAMHGNIGWFRLVHRSRLR